MPGTRYLNLIRIIVVLLLMFLGSSLIFETELAVHPVRAATEIFFSEYVEGSGNNKALEIFNGTSATVDLTAENYDVQFFFNGNPSAGATILLSGSIVPGDVYVIADAGADPTIVAVADLIYSGSFFNGDDAIALRKNGTIIDVIGQIGVDPGTQWGVVPTNTQDNTLRRKTGIASGDINGSDPFDPQLEWDGFGKDKFDGLGFHPVIMADDPPAVVSTTPTNNANNVTPDTTIRFTFTEPVSLAGDWFELRCDQTGPHTPTNSAVSGGPVSWTIDPNIDFAAGESCTVTIFAAQITDQDAPPDLMASDYQFSFKVVAATTASGWAINEIHADPDGSGGDANGDGTVSSTQDEFVEIINNTGGIVDISSWTLADNNSVRYTFPAGSMIPDQCAIVIFGGGAPAGTFGQAIVQTAGSLGLNNNGDTVTLADIGSTVQATYTYGSEGDQNQSLTRFPDLTGSPPLILHSSVAASGGRLFSPGTGVDGTAFGSCDVPPAVVATMPSPDTTNIMVNTSIMLGFSELVAITASAFALECPNGTPIPFTVTSNLSGPADTFTLIPTANLPYGTSCTVTVNKNEVIDQDGTPEPLLTDYSFTFVTAPPPAALLISEFLYDGLTPSSEGDEFVELCNTVHHLNFRLILLSENEKG